MNTRTNNVPRDVINECELLAHERAEFDYIDWPAVDRGEGSASFFRYRGQLYDLGEFTAYNPQRDAPNLIGGAGGWDGYLADSFFSAVVVRYVDDFERVVVGVITT